MSASPTSPSPAPSFYITPPQRLGLSSLLPAFVLALASLLAVRAALGHNHGHLFGRSTGEDADDPNQVDTIYLGGPNQAPTATRPAHYNPVHPFVVVHLPRAASDTTGLIPDTPAGHALYSWLAAFNNKDPTVAGDALPTPRFPDVAAAQIELRRQTGGFTLISTRELEPGLLVFRLEDQNTPAHQVLGTLQLRPSAPPSIESLSLRAIP